jgi:pimeloyl-ACP methyl ester carboxylesterase
MGGGIATRLAERYPRRIDGVLAISGVQDMQANLNRGLDVTFAVRTLLTDDQNLELVKAADPEHSVQVLQQAAAQALTTPEGRAKLALIGAVGGCRPGRAPTSRRRPTWSRASASRSGGPRRPTSPRWDRRAGSTSNGVLAATPRSTSVSTTPGNSPAPARVTSSTGRTGQRA